MKYRNMDRNFRDDVQHNIYIYIIIQRKCLDEVTIAGLAHAHPIMYT